MVELMRFNRANARRSFDVNCNRTASRSPEVMLGSAVTVTVPAETVGLRIKRLPQHRMMSGNVWDGFKLVRRSYYGRYYRPQRYVSVRCKVYGRAFFVMKLTMCNAQAI